MWKKLFTVAALLALTAGCSKATPAPTTTTPAADTTPATMSTMDPAEHMKLISTPGKGGQPLEFTLDKDVKVFKLEAKEVDWETSPGHTVKAWTFNGTVPGPTIHVTEGDKIRLVITNHLPEATSLHPHGLKVPNGMDGVPGLGGAKAIQPGETQIMEFTATPAGTHWYHPHVDSAMQISKGMYGAIIVDPKTPSTVKYNRDYTVMIGDGGDLGYVLNGKGFPSTEPITVKEGERVRMRFIGTGVMSHPMHLHGHVMKVIGREDGPIPNPYETDTISVAPGESWDVEFTADNPGDWPLHCHIIPHAEKADGTMYGLAMVVHYEK